MNEPVASETLDWEMVMPGFRYALFERIDPEANAYRQYLFLWQPTLFGKGAVVRQFGRIGQDHQLRVTCRGLAYDPPDREDPTSPPLPVSRCWGGVVLGGKSVP